MNEFKIIRAQANTRSEMKRIGYAMMGSTPVFAAHRLLVELAYDRVSEISGLPKSALIPPTIITDSKSLTGSGSGWGTREVIRHALKENADIVADSLPPEYRKGLDTEGAIGNVIRALDDISTGAQWDNYLFNGMLPAIVVMNGVGRAKRGLKETVSAVAQMLRGHLTALEALVNTQFWNAPKNEHKLHEREIEIGTILSTIVCASYGLGELEKVLAGKGDARNYDMAYLDGLRIEWLRTLRDLMYENCGANLAMLLNFKSELARYELGAIEEFSTRRQLEAFEGEGVRVKRLADLLTERNVLIEGRLTEKAREDISANVHGFFMQGMVRE